MTQQKKQLFQTVVPAYLSAWAAMLLCGLTTFHPAVLLFFAAFFILYRHLFFPDQSDASVPAPALRKERITSVILSFLFTLFTLCADYETILRGLANRFFQAFHLLVCALGLFLFLYVLFTRCLVHTRCFSPALNGNAEDSPFRKRLPLWAFFFCFLCWLPYFLTNFPAIMTVDSLNQYGQIIGALPYSNHHPWLHTQLIHFWYAFGQLLFGSVTAGLACYTLFQMTVLALVVSYVTATLIRCRVRTGICLLTLAFFALVPYNGIYAVTMWKDILFSYMTLLFTTVLLRFVLSKPFEKPAITDSLLYLLSGFGMCLLRSNGWYAFLLTMPFVLFSLRRQWKLHIVLNLLVLSAVLFVKGPVMNSCEVAQPDFVESLSIPVQQAARVYYEGQSTAPEDDAMWNRIMDISRIPDTYYNRCSDNIKSLIREGNPAYLDTHKGDYAMLWLRFGLRHPGAYLRAYLDATEGYWYPDIPNLIGSNERIAENEYGLTARPLLSNPLTVKLKEIIFKLQDMLPLYGLLWSLGALFWAALLFLGKAFAHQKPVRLLLFLPNLAVMATLFVATPVYNEFRYAYSLILSLPLFLIACAYQGEQDSQ